MSSIINNYYCFKMQYHDKNMKKKVWFIRHGQSLVNADENFISDDFSSAKASLSDEGFRQAEKLLEHFSDSPDLFITSSFVRTKETAAPLLKKYPNVAHEEWAIQEFTYIADKRCYNTTLLEKGSLKKEYWNRNNHLHYDGEGAESFIDFINRVQDTLENIKKRKENFIVLFSHNYTIAAVKYILKNKPKEITAELMKDFKEYYEANPIRNAEKIEIEIL